MWTGLTDFAAGSSGTRHQYKRMCVAVHSASSGAQNVSEKEKNRVL